jgi:hypothetical protein
MENTFSTEEIAELKGFRDGVEATTGIWNNIVRAKELEIEEEDWDDEDDIKPSKLFGKILLTGIAIFAVGQIYTHRSKITSFAKAITGRTTEESPFDDDDDDTGIKITHF